MCCFPCHNSESQYGWHCLCPMPLTKVSNSMATLFPIPSPVLGLEFVSLISISERAAVSTGIANRAYSPAIILNHEGYAITRSSGGARVILKVNVVVKPFFTGCCTLNQAAATRFPASGVRRSTVGLESVCRKNVGSPLTLPLNASNSGSPRSPECSSGSAPEPA